MAKLTRRKFIGFLGLGSVVSVWPFSLFSRNSSDQISSKVKEIFKLLKKKRDSIKTLSYSVFQKVVYVNPKVLNNPKRDDILTDIKGEFYLKQDKWKVIIYLPTETTPKGFGAKFTSIYKNQKKYEKRESLDGSFKTEYHSQWLSQSEWKDRWFHAMGDVILPIPQDNLMTLVGKEYIEGELTYVIIQGNRKYWISLEKVSVIKQEIYRTSNQLFMGVEYKKFKEVLPGIFLPTLVIEKYFDNKNIEKVYEKEITNIKLNEWIPDEIFNVEQEKYNE